VDSSATNIAASADANDVYASELYASRLATRRDARNGNDDVNGDGKS